MIVKLTRSQIEKMMKEKSNLNAKFEEQFEATAKQIEEFPEGMDPEEFASRMRIAFYIFFMQGVEEGRRLLGEEASKN